MILIYQMTRHLKHCRKIIIVLPSTMMSKMSQYSNPVTQPFLSRSIRVPITEVGCLSFTQILQDYLHAYQPPSQADTYSQIQGMAQWLDMYVNKYPA